jgi:pimeloyl-ACP methyl ester carboxylesterase
MRRILIFLVAATIGTVWVGDRLPGDHEPPFAAQYIEVDSLVLRAAVGGAGDPAIILLHGFAESAGAWRAVGAGLVGDFRVIAFDLPGHGLSDKPSSGYGVEELGARIGSALEAIGERRVVLVGHSMGGAIAAWVAASRPDLVERLVLIDAAGLAGPVLSSSGDLPPGAVAALFGAGAAMHGPSDPAWLADSLAEGVYQPSADPAYYAALEAVLREFDFVGLDSVMSEIKQPTLVIWGRHDRLTPIANGERIVELVPDATLVVIRDALHRPHTTHPSEVQSLVSQFAKGHD